MSLMFCSVCQKLCRSGGALVQKSRSVFGGNGQKSFFGTYPLPENLGGRKELLKSGLPFSPQLGRRFFFRKQASYNAFDKDYKSDPVKETTSSEEEIFNETETGKGQIEVELENLTEEERNVLQELEEEEQKYREFLSKEMRDLEDYSFWNPRDGKENQRQLLESVKEGHVPFENRRRVIQDVIDEMWNPLPEEDEEILEPQIFPRGNTGVFDLGELVDLLKEEGAEELVAINLPKEIDYADHMVIVTVGNNRQLLALATFVRKRFKMKDRKKYDKLPHLSKTINHEGWIALDLGNIILQIFLQDVRDYYDLETLWTVGPLYDDLCNAKDPEIIQLLNTISKEMQK